MLKKILLVTLIIYLSLGVIIPSNAQTEKEKIVEPIKLEAKIKSENFVGVNKKIIFDASNSIVSSSLKQTYTWNFGDKNESIGKDAVHQYTKTGKYNVKLTVKQDKEIVITEKQIFVYDKKALLILDENKTEEINQIKLQAAENGVALTILSTVKEEGGFLSEDNLLKEITKISDYIKDSDILIFYNRSALGLQTFTRFWQNLESSDKKLIGEKFFIDITDNNIDVASNFTYQSFKIIKPEFILLTRKEALPPIFTVKNYDDAVGLLKSRGIEYKIVDDRVKKSQIFVLSNLITNFISKGVSSNTIYLILIIPFIACIVIFSRQIIGLSTFGIYTPVITTASFYILGLRYGIITFLFAVIVGYIFKYLLNKIEVLYLAKVALNLGIISLSFLFIIWLFLYLKAPISLSVAIFPILVMSSITEKFMAAQSEEGFKGALFGITETILVVIASYYLISWIAFNNIIMSWPELVVVPLIIILLIGKFTGLRLSEYLRFRSLFSDHTEE